MVSGWILFPLLMGAVGARPDTLVLIPTVIQMESPEKLCVVQSTGVGSGPLRVNIHHGPSNTTLLDQEITGVEHYGCVEFMVPEVQIDNHWRSVATVTVIGSGETAAINITKRVLLRKYQSLTFVQTDKPVYKPGQTVRFRVVSLTMDFQLSQEEYPLITLWDPQRNRIGQWRDVKGRQGIVDLSFDLIPEPPMGEYKIEVEKTHGKNSHTFTVEEYVLPKFEVKVHLPNAITILDKTINVKVCGRYTYGKPMRGHVNGTVCLKRYYSAMDSTLCHHVEGETDTDGCFSRDLSTAIFHLRRNWQRTIQAHFVLDEQGTGIKREAVATCRIASEVTNLRFEEMEDYYKRGIPYTGKLVIKYATGKPVPRAKVYLFHSAKPGAQVITVDEHGEGKFQLNTSSWENGQVTFMAIYHLQADYADYSFRIPGHNLARHSAKCFYSKSGSFLSIQKHHRELPCDSDLNLSVDYIIKGLPDSGPLDLEVFHLVMAKMKINSFEKTSLVVGGTSGTEGTLLLQQRVSWDLAPIARILVFAVLPDGEMIGDTVKFSVSKCFHNKVQLHFSTSEDLPGTQISLDLHADPGSWCGLRVVDQSVLLLKPEKELSADSIYSLLPLSDLSGYQYLVKDDEQQFCKPDNRGTQLALDQRWLVYDLAKLIEGMELKIFTNLDYFVPLNCMLPTRWEYQRRYYHGGVAQVNTLMGAPMVLSSRLQDSHPDPVVGTSLPAENVREYFPETWIWDLIPVSSTGRTSLDVSVPDAITEWRGNVFCGGESGFGMSDTASFVAFKPFFVDVALPYSVVRTEGFTLKAKVFNYMTQSLMVKVVLLEAQGFELKSSDREFEVCVLSKDSVTVSWQLVAVALGEVNVTVRAESIHSSTLCGNEVVTVPKKGAVDIIRKPVLIEPEGSETELSHSSLLCPAGKTITEQIHLQVPANVVEGSARAYVTVLGDLMGSAMENLDGLLRLPTGCGEQNMVKFAPNIYVLSYLEKTHQLTPEIKSKAIGFLKTGYQRQLTYKHHDGSFSAFGNSDAEGNTWLTAFVLKSFLHAQPYIFIDDSVLRAAAGFFLKYRLESGCFASLGKLFNNAMKGGVDDHISLSAYVTTALLNLLKLRPNMASEVYEKTRERGHEISSINELVLEDPDHALMSSTDGEKTKPLNFKTAVVDVSLGCLRKEMETVNNTYTLALLAYTFTLAGDTTSRERLLNRLEALSVTKDGLKHWQRAADPEEEEEEEEEEEVWYWWRAPSAEVEMTAYVLLALLSKPQVSPSDLQQAVPIVSWLVRQRNSYGGFASTQDTVVALHALSLYGRLTHATDPQGSVSLTGENGFHREFHLDASNQLLLQREKLEHVPGDYTVQISGTSCLLLQTTLRYNTPPTPKLSAFRLSVNMETEAQDQTTGKVNINVSYVGSRNVSNMVIVDLKLLSGYSAEKPSHPSVSRTETQNEHLVMYIRQMEAFHPVQLSVTVHRDFEVDNLQEAHVKVYDYYETDESAIAGYHVSPLHGSSAKDPSATEGLDSHHTEKRG
ncbi:murinoglobulin-2-like isoform X2 [Pristis pectinata]|uniref:murinoglobulin-2-like isoform X2 n=1 Tax=Pristis pectinata TaxID=685728 RepID=UPI00223C9BE6|nr:murinoglobulin-2-like isoform X2 [Pristis pectinata]